LIRAYYDATPAVVAYSITDQRFPSTMPVWPLTISATVYNWRRMDLIVYVRREGAYSQRESDEDKGNAELHRTLDKLRRFG
jgi:hypothetical protein